MRKFLFCAVLPVLAGFWDPCLAGSLDDLDLDGELPSRYEHVTVKVDSQTQFENYPVRAELPELGDALLAAAPQGSYGSLRSLAKLRLDVDWDVNADQGRQMCDLHRVTISSNAVFITPQWDHGELSPEDEEKWDDFLEALNNYHNENRKILQRHLDSFRQELLGIRPGRNCQELRHRIDEMGLAHLRDAGAEIDAIAMETNSGGDYQGMSFPDFYSGKAEPAPAPAPVPEAGSGEAKPSPGKPAAASRQGKGQRSKK